AQSTRYPGLFWSYPPSLDAQAQEYASLVCTRIVAPGRVTFSGNGDTGKARKYGLLLTDDGNASAEHEREKLTEQYLQKDCSPRIADTAYFHYSGSNS